MNRWRDFFHARHWQPREVGAAEWFWLRVLFAIVIAWSMRDVVPYSFTDQPEPRGMARVVSLRFLHEPWARPACMIAGGGFLLLYVSGRATLSALIGLTLLSTVVRTYANSQGAINHSVQVVTLTLLAQTITLAILRRQGKTTADARPYLLYYSQAVLAATYFTSVVVKVVNSKGLWIWNSSHLPLELVKSQREAYYSRLESSFSGEVEHVTWLLAHPWFCRLLFGSGFALEALALLALRGRCWSLALGLGLVAMHQSIEYLMKLNFHYNVALLVVFFINVPGLLYTWRGRKPSAV